MAEEHLRAAASAGLLAAEDSQRALLQSVVEVARAIFGARACSILLLDEQADELVFEAVAGEGSRTLVGRRFPSSVGIAGWVLISGQPLVLDDVASDTRFAKDVAENTGFVPKRLMAAPLIDGERALGVLSVLDRPEGREFSLREADLLSLFANQAGIALDVVQRSRRARAVLADSGAEGSALARLAAALDALEGEKREAGLRLIEAAEKLMES
jgi:GAF domain-containing protein